MVLRHTVMASFLKPPYYPIWLEMYSIVTVTTHVQARLPMYYKGSSESDKVVLVQILSTSLNVYVYNFLGNCI